MDSSIRVSQVISILFGAYGQAGDTNRQAIYCQFCKDIPPALLEAGVKKLIVEQKFLPTVSEIVDTCKEIVSAADETVRIKGWDEAWGEIERALYATPWGKTPTFSAPEIADVVNRFGWRNLQVCQSSEYSTIRAQIRDMYKAICERSKKQGSNAYALGHDRRGLFLPRGVASESSALVSIQEIVKSMHTSESKNTV